MAAVNSVIRHLAFRALSSRVQHTSKLAAIGVSPYLHINAIAKRGLATSTQLFHHVAVQQPAPDFEGTAVVNGEFKNISLKDYKGKYLVLLFYPLDFTFVCPTEIIAFSQKASEFRQVNTQVIGISVDSQFSHLAWINTPKKEGGLGSLNFPLLSDLQKKISRDYGVLLEDAGVALRVIRKPLQALSHPCRLRLASLLRKVSRGLFLIDPDGMVRHMSVNDLPVGRSVEEILRLVKAFQFVETHGEVCPAGWQPDAETIKPDPKGSKEYFEKVN